MSDSLGSFRAVQRRTVPVPKAPLDLGAIHKALSVDSREAGGLASKEQRPLGRKDYQLKLY